MLDAILAVTMGYGVQQRNKKLRVLLLPEDKLEYKIVQKAVDFFLAHPSILHQIFEDFKKWEKRGGPDRVCQEIFYIDIYKNERYI